MRIRLMALLQRDGSIDFRSSPESKRQIHVKLRSSPSNAQAGRCLILAARRRRPTTSAHRWMSCHRGDDVQYRMTRYTSAAQRRAMMIGIQKGHGDLEPKIR